MIDKKDIILIKSINFLAYPSYIKGKASSDYTPTRHNIEMIYKVK